MSDILLILLPGTMYFWVLFVGGGPLQEVLKEKETRILPRLLACPVTTTQYILSKMLRCFVLCCLALTLLLVSSALLFGVEWGPPLRLAAVTGVWASSMTGLLALIYALVRTQEQANVLPPVLLVVVGMVGGSMFPYENLPGFLQMLGRFTPNRWAVLALLGVVRDRPVGELLWPFAGLVAVGVVGSLCAFALFRRQLLNGRRK